MIFHAGLIARWDGGHWRGVLIEGASGSGKSDLALRALDAGWALVADDRTLIWASGGQLFGRAAPAIAGLIEARGVGVLAAPARAFATIHLIVQCVEADAVERMPEIEAADLLGLAIPRLNLATREASALAKLAYAVCHLGLRP